MLGFIHDIVYFRLFKYLLIALEMIIYCAFIIIYLTNQKLIYQTNINSMKKNKFVIEFFGENLFVYY